jgi:hypothetical protein
MLLKMKLACRLTVDRRDGSEGGSHPSSNNAEWRKMRITMKVKPRPYKMWQQQLVQCLKLSNVTPFVGIT